MNMAGIRTPLQQLFQLEERARLAGVHLPDESTSGTGEFFGVKCVVNGLDCVISMRHVVEAIDPKKVTAIPGTADWVDGVMNYRGSMVPVFRLHALMKLPQGVDLSLATIDGPILVLRQRRGNRNNGEYSAVRLNRMMGMQQFRESDVQALEADRPATEGVEQFVHERISSEGRHWNLLDIASLLDHVSGINPRRM